MPGAVVLARAEGRQRARGSPRIRRTVGGKVPRGRNVLRRARSARSTIPCVPRSFPRASRSEGRGWRLARSGAEVRARSWVAGVSERKRHLSANERRGTVEREKLNVVEPHVGWWCPPIKELDDAKACAVFEFVDVAH